jgi:hypothetical protein
VRNTTRQTVVIHADGPRILRPALQRARARLVPCVLCGASTNRRITVDFGVCVGCERRPLSKARGQVGIVLPVAWRARS